MSNQEASTVARALVETVVVRYGVPLQILTDQGKNFEGTLFKEMCRLLDIDKVRTTSYHPRCNGMIERFHRTLNTMLGKVVSTHQRDWDEFLPYVMAANRASNHEVTGFSPNYLIFGRENRAPLDIVFGQPESPGGERITYADYAAGLEERFEVAYRLMRESLGRAAERRKRRYDLRVRPLQFRAGQWVWYLTPRRFVGRSPKWGRQYTGPFMVVRACGPVDYLLQRSPKAKVFVAHVDKLRVCHGRTDGSWEEEATPSENEAPVAAVEMWDAPRRLQPPRAARRPARYC